MTPPASQVESRLADLGPPLPAVTKPAANYIPWTRAGGTIYVAGQVPMVEGKIAYTGTVGPGGDHSLEEAKGIAEVCARNVIAILKAAAEEAGKTLDDVRIVRLGGFVNCAPGFTDIHLVTNGASDLIAAVFGERGKHARSAIGVAELPLDAPFELEATAVLE